MIKAYYRLAKPGIVYGNLLPALAGFFLASRGYPNWRTLLFMATGLSLVIASACVLNNIYDAEWDAKMARTKIRAIPSGVISKTKAKVFALSLFAAGSLALLYFTNPPALLCAWFGFVFYVFAYTPLKHRTVYATLLGSLPGAAPPLVGFAAASGHLGLGAYLLFLLLVFWQMPHFYAIAIYRQKDYEQAGVPVWPIDKGVYSAQTQIIVFILAFIMTNGLLGYYGTAAKSVAILGGFFGAWWLILALKGFAAANQEQWAKQLFLFSLIVLTAECLLLSLSSFLP